MSEDRLTAASLSTPLLEIDIEPFRSREIRFFLKREDLVDSEHSGNKFYKLHHHLLAAGQGGHTRLLSFGGAWSNHIHALAAAGQRLGLQTIGVIRGEIPARLSATLSDARERGMELYFLDRQSYRQKNSPALLDDLRRRFGDFYLIPEGGSGALGALGCQAITRGIVDQCPVPVDYIGVACGTGATLAGIASARMCTNRPVALGFSVLKGAGDLSAQVASLLAELGAGDAPWRLYSDFHCGGYARLPGYLSTFMRNFEAQTSIVLDPVYTVKMIWGLCELVQKGELADAKCIVAVHTGGLQGRRGFDLPYTEQKLHTEHKGR